MTKYLSISISYLKGSIGLLEEGVDIVTLGRLSEVISGREDVANACENHQVNSLIVVDLGQDPGHLLVGEPVDAVLLFRVVEFHDEQLALLLHKKLLESLVRHLDGNVLDRMNSKVQLGDHFTLIAGVYCC